MSAKRGQVMVPGVTDTIRKKLQGKVEWNS
jgi:hypothetical protein